MPGEQFQIVLEENAKPVCVTTQRSIPFHYKEALKRELDKLEEKGIIAKQTAPMPWCLPVVIERESGRHMFVRRFQADELLCYSRTVSTQHAGGGRCRPGIGQNRREHRPYAPAESIGPMLPPPQANLMMTSNLSSIQIGTCFAFFDRFSTVFRA